MRALRTTTSGMGISEALEAARKIYGIDGLITDLAGERDRNFSIRATDGTGFVLKFLDDAADPPTVDCQIGLLRHVAEQDANLPVPRVRSTLSGASSGNWSHEGSAQATLLVDLLPGICLSSIRPDPPMLGELGKTIGRLDRALQGFFHPALGQSLVWDMRRLPELAGFIPYIAAQDTRRLVSDAVAECTESLPRWRGLASQAIHGDCHSGNVLIDGTALKITGVIDFGDAIHAPRVFEPAVSSAELLMEGSSTLDGVFELLRAYDSVRPLTHAEAACLYDLIRARHAVALLVHAWRARHDPSGAAALGAAMAQGDRSLEELTHVGREGFTAAWQASGSLRLGGLEPASMEPLLQRRQRLLGAGAELFYERPLHIVRGEDVWLFDATGRRYLDVYNNVPHVGHAHPAVVAAVRRQTALLATNTRYLHEKILDYAQRLTGRLPAPLDTCIFVNSGSEANDVAWRIAQFVTGRSGALIMEHAYHGITAAVAALTPAAGEPRDDRVLGLKAPPRGLRIHDTPSAADIAGSGHDCERALERLNERGHAPAAWYLDTAFTSNGIFDPPPAWLAPIVQGVRAAGALIVGDEVQYGLGRSGSHCWGFERRGFVPDIVTLGKPIGNGFPLGVVIAGRAVVEEFQARFGLFSTFGGNAVAAAAGLAVLDVLESEGLQANAERTGAYLRERLEDLAARYACFGQLRGAGLLLGLDIVDAVGEASRSQARRFVNALCAHGVLSGLEGPLGNVLKLRPPMSFRREHADMLAQALAATAVALGAAQARGSASA